MRRSLVLSDQKAFAKTAKANMNTLVAELSKRDSVWFEVDVNTQQKWLSSNKDPVLNLAWDTYCILRKYFEGLEVNK